MPGYSYPGSRYPGGSPDRRRNIGGFGDTVPGISPPAGLRPPPSAPSFVSTVRGLGGCCCGPCVPARKRIIAWQSWNGIDSLRNHFNNPALPADAQFGHEFPYFEDVVFNDCNIRWTQITVTSVWDTPWTSTGDGSGEFPEDVHNVTVGNIPRRLNGSFTQYEPTQYLGQKIANDTLEDAANASAVASIDVWDVTLSDSGYHVEIQFTDVSSNVFVGSRTVSLGAPYDKGALLGNLQFLLNTVRHTDYPWLTDLEPCNNDLDIFVTWKAPPEDNLFKNDTDPAVIQACILSGDDPDNPCEPLDPSVHLHHDDPNAEICYQVLALTDCCMTADGGFNEFPQNFGQPAMPTDCDTDKYGACSDGFYFDAAFAFASNTVGPSAIACVALVKSWVKFEGEYSNVTFEKDLPYPSNPAIENPAMSGNFCNAVWTKASESCDLTKVGCSTIEVNPVTTKQYIRRLIAAIPVIPPP